MPEGWGRHSVWVLFSRIVIGYLRKDGTPGLLAQWDSWEWRGGRLVSREAILPRKLRRKGGGMGVRIFTCLRLAAWHGRDSWQYLLNE